MLKNKHSFITKYGKINGASPLRMSSGYVFGYVLSKNQGSFEKVCFSVCCFTFDIDILYQQAKAPFHRILSDFLYI